VHVGPVKYEINAPFARQRTRRNELVEKAVSDDALHRAEKQGYAGACDRPGHSWDDSSIPKGQASTTWLVGLPYVPFA